VGRSPVATTQGVEDHPATNRHPESAGVDRTPSSTPQDVARSLLSRRNQDGASGAPTQWNGVLETMISGRSVRGFLPTLCRMARWNC
jgi:hypothetical protein